MSPSTAAALARIRGLSLGAPGPGGHGGEAEPVEGEHRVHHHLGVGAGEEGDEVGTRRVARGRGASPAWRRLSRSGSLTAVSTRAWISAGSSRRSRADGLGLGEQVLHQPLVFPLLGQRPQQHLLVGVAEDGVHLLVAGVARHVRAQLPAPPRSGRPRSPPARPSDPPGRQRRPRTEGDRRQGRRAPGARRVRREGTVPSYEPSLRRRSGSGGRTRRCAAILPPPVRRQTPQWSGTWGRGSVCTRSPECQGCITAAGPRRAACPPGVRWEAPSGGAGRRRAPGSAPREARA